MKSFQRINSAVLLNQDEFGTNCAVDKHTKISFELQYRLIFKRSNIGR